MRRLPRTMPLRDTKSPAAVDPDGSRTAADDEPCVEAAPGAPVALRAARVVVPPVIVQGRICRVVAPVLSLLEVQEWTGEYWLPSQLPLYGVRDAPRATAKRLESAGVPRDEWDAPPPEPPIMSVSQLLLVAMLMSAEARAADGYAAARQAAD